MANYTVSQINCATLTMAITCQFSIDLQKIVAAAKSDKLQTKHVLAYPPHFKYVAALPWET